MAQARAAADVLAAVKVPSTCLSHWPMQFQPVKNSDIVTSMASDELDAVDRLSDAAQHCY
jgi:hypothetical protein